MRRRKPLSYGKEGGAPSFFDFFVSVCYNQNIGKTVVA